MLKKSLSFAALILGIGMLNAADTKPRFKDNYIKLVTQGGLCGGVTIKPKANVGQVMLESYVYYSPAGTDEANTTDGRLGSYGDYLNEPGDDKGNGLDSGGKRFRYDWAGAGSLTHYRIYCKTRRTKLDYWTEANCEWVVDLENKRHNKSCGAPDSISGPGVWAVDGYKGLKMNQG